MGLKPRALTAQSSSNEEISAVDERALEHDGFGESVIRQFGKMTQRTFTPPHFTIFRVARELGYLRVYINGWTEATWRIKMDALIEEGDRRIFALAVYLNGPFDHEEAVGFGWANSGALVRAPLRKKLVGLDSPFYCQPCADAGRKDCLGVVFVAQWGEGDKHHWTAVCRSCAEGWYGRDDGLPHIEVTIAAKLVGKGSVNA